MTCGRFSHLIPALCSVFRVTNNSPSPPDTSVQDDASREDSLTLSRQSRHPGLVLPGYHFERCLGDGAFGSVWLAREENTGRQVAVKVYSHHRRLDWSLLSREVEKLAALDSSRNIVGLLAVGWESDPPYYVMEYLENGSLAGYLSDGPIPPGDAVRIAKGVLHGLVHAHGRGILHCDLKPGNVLLDDDFSPRLCDFGQSRLSHEQDPALGTLYYMAPEQADLGAMPDARWDVYALGALLYHLLTGTPPYRTSETERELSTTSSLTERLTAYRSIVTTNTRSPILRNQPGIDRRLADLVDRCLENDPADRFANAQSALAAFDDRERRRARRPLLALGGLLPLLLMAAMFLFGITATNDAVATAQRNLINRAIESDTVSARIMARGVLRELASWQEELSTVANSPRLIELLTSAKARGWSRRDALEEHLANSQSLATQRRESSGQLPDASWFVVDAHGYQRWRGPANKRTLDRQWAHRDYFHGQGREYDEDELPTDLAPITETHLSLAFQSRATGRAIVALSVPIKDKTGSVIAILAGTRELGSVLSAPYAEYKPSLDSTLTVDVARTVAILDSRDGRLLDHPWLQSHTQTAPIVTLDKPTRTAFSAADASTDHTIRLDNYLDPAGNHSDNFQGQWLAAASPVGNFGWLAVVQERRDRALQPVFAMRSNVLTTWKIALTVSGLLLTGIWAFVLISIGKTSSRDDSTTAFNVNTPVGGERPRAREVPDA